MNCPICNSKMPYGLQIHLAAAHGPNSLQQKLKEAGADNEPLPGERPPPGRNRRKRGRNRRRNRFGKGGNHKPNH